VNLNESEITALCDRFEARAKAIVQEAVLAARSVKFRDCVRLTGMASSFQWAAREVYLCARISQTEGKAEPDQRTKRRVYRPAHGGPSS
jgi:hypothetical protein